MSSGAGRAHVAFVVVCALGLGGCMHVQPKTVASKDPPSTLIATDGSVCSVSEKYFESTIVGMMAVCEWHGGSIKTFGNRTTSKGKQ